MWVPDIVSEQLGCTRRKRWREAVLPALGGGQRQGHNQSIWEPGRPVRVRTILYFRSTVTAHQVCVRVLRGWWIWASPRGLYDADFDPERVEATILWERPFGEAVPSNTQTNGRVSYFHLMLRLRSDARGSELR